MNARVGGKGIPGPSMEGGAIQLTVVGLCDQWNVLECSSVHSLSSDNKRELET